MFAARGEKWILHRAPQEKMEGGGSIDGEEMRVVGCAQLT